MPQKTWLLSADFIYEITGSDPLGEYSIEIDPEYTVVGDPDAVGIPYSVNTTTVTFVDTVYVDDDAPDDPGPGDPAVSDPLENGSLDHPYDSIAEAIAAAADGMLVVVMDGTYTGAGNRDLSFNGKKIEVRSQNGPSRCVIDCGAAGRAFIFDSGESSDSVLRGLTITGGSAGKGGGVYCNGASPIIRNNVIAGNSAQLGGGIALENSSTQIKFNTIAGNSASVSGGGLYANASSPLGQNLILWGNTCGEGAQVAAKGSSTMVLTHSDVAGGQAAASQESGSMIVFGIGTINVDPLFANPGSLITT